MLPSEVTDKLDGVHENLAKVMVSTQVDNPDHRETAESYKAMKEDALRTVGMDGTLIIRITEQQVLFTGDIREAAAGL